jgi:methionine-rich copper-binding protein CopC
MLYPADSVPDGNYARRRPSYAAQTDSAGQYSLRYLRPGRYRIFGVVEKDRNFRYNTPSEKVAFTLDDEWMVAQQRNDDGKTTPCTRIVNLQAFIPDTFPPGLISVKPLNERNFLLNFNEPVIDVRIRVDERKKDSIFVRDSEVRPPTNDYIRLYGVESDGPKTVRLPGAVFGRRDTLQFRLWAADTAGMWTDTVLTFVPKVSDASSKLRFSRAAPPDDAPQTVALVFNSPVSPPFSGIYWLDTANAKIPATIHPGRSPYEIFISPPSDSLTPLRWAIDTAFFSDDGFRFDSLVYETYTPVELDNYASVSGVASPAAVVVFLAGKGQTYSTVPDAKGRFSFPYVPAGEYTLYAVHDTDGNRRWTPGSVTPRRPPEKVVFHPEKLKLRAGWKTENVKLNAE